MATLNPIKTKKDLEISKEFFKKYTTCAEISRELYSIDSKSKTKTIGTVTRCYRKWKEKGYLDTARVSRSKNKGTITGYRLNLKPFFEYANEKIREVREREWVIRKNKLSKAKDRDHKEILQDLIKRVKEKEFNKKEEKFLEYIFGLPKIREMACNRETLFDGITNVLEKIFFYHRIVGKTLCIDIAKAFFVEDKRQFKKVSDSYGQYKEFQRAIINFLDGLVNKIKDLTSFNPGDYHELIYNTKISTYSDIPFAIPKHYSEENKKRLLKRFEIVFYEKRKPTNNELLETRQI